VGNPAASSRATVLKPGQSFEYQSGSQLSTEMGTMHGTYRMQAEDGTTFDATIPRFTLSMPRTLH
jgi:ApaG protein